MIHRQMHDLALASRNLSDEDNGSYLQNDAGQTIQQLWRPGCVDGSGKFEIGRTIMSK